MRQLAIVCVLVIAAASGGQAATFEGVTMEDEVSVAEETLTLNGMALRSKYFFSVYVAGLYLPSPSSDASMVLDKDATRRVVMHWLRSVPKDKICEGWWDGLDANTPDASDELRSQFETLCGWMQDAEEGDRFVFTYVPDEGTEVVVAGASKGTIPGKAFADALFASWIGAEPGPGVEFREKLMGK